MTNVILFIIAIFALLVILANLGGLIMFAASIFILYLIIKQFMKSDTTANKILWLVLGFIVLGKAASFSYSIIGIVAAVILYLIIKQWRENKEEITI